MERQEIRIQMSRRTRRLLSRAFGAGVDSAHLNAEAQRAIREAQSNRGERVTRGAFKDLRDEVVSLLSEKRLEEIGNRVHWDPTESSL